MLADESEEFSQIVGGIYDSVLRPEGWAEALAGVCGFVGGIAANLFWHDLAGRGVEVVHSVGENEGYTRSYVETYRLMNPYFPAAAFFPAGQVFTGVDVIPHERFLQTRFYREWVRPQGYIDFLGANLVRSETAAAIVSVRRSERQGVADETAVRRMRLVTPHLRRAVLISSTFLEQERDGETLEDLLELIAAGVFLVDPSGTILRTNGEGEGLLAAGAQVRSVGGRLQANDPRARQILAAALRRTDVGEVLGVQGVAIPLEGVSQGAWFAHVLPLPSASPREGAGRASAAVFVRRAQLDVEPPLAMVSRLHGLTPAETRVLGAVVELGGGVSEAAAALDLSATTVRAHLRRLFEKTGTGRQADLLKLVAAHRTALGRTA